jgi:hypothetical protein
MSAGCEWNISPSYDLTYAINRGAGSEHQLSINNAPASWATYKELSKIAETFGIRDHKEIIGNTLEAKHTMLRKLSCKYDIADLWIDEIMKNTKSIDEKIVPERSR